jgi:hypothetical protein
MGAKMAKKPYTDDDLEIRTYDYEKGPKGKTTKYHWTVGIKLSGPILKEGYAGTERAAASAVAEAKQDIINKSRGR